MPPITNPVVKIIRRNFPAGTGRDLSLQQFGRDCASNPHLQLLHHFHKRRRILHNVEMYILLSRIKKIQ